MLAIPFMELSAPQAEAALDTSRESFRAFYDDALPRIYGYFLQRCGGSVAIAEDLTEETFLAAVRELKKGKKVEAHCAHLRARHARRPRADAACRSPRRFGRHARQLPVDHW